MWNYRLIEYDGESRNRINGHLYEGVGLHEIYYDQDGKIYGYTSEPIELVGHSPKELLDEIETIKNDITNNGVIKESNLEKMFGRDNTPPFDFYKNIKTPISKDGINCFFSEEDNGFIATVASNSGFSAFGETPFEAILELCVALSAIYDMYTKERDKNTEYKNSTKDMGKNK